MELGLALVAVGKDALANFCRRLSKQDTTQMLQYVSAFPHADEIESKVARRFLSKIATNIDDKSTLMEMAALWRIAKASKTEGAHSLTASCTGYLCSGTSIANW